MTPDEVKGLRSALVILLDAVDSDMVGIEIDDEQDAAIYFKAVEIARAALNASGDDQTAVPSATPTPKGIDAFDEDMADAARTKCPKCDEPYEVVRPGKIQPSCSCEYIDGLVRDRDEAQAERDAIHEVENAVRETLEATEAERDRLRDALTKNHCALADLGSRIQCGPGGYWQIRHPHSEMPRAINAANEAMLAYHAATARAVKVIDSTGELEVKPT